MPNPFPSVSKRHLKQKSSTTIFPPSSHLSRTANNASSHSLPHTSHTHSSHNHCMQMDCCFRLHLHSCPCPCPHPCYRLRSAVVCRSRRSEAGARRAVAVFGARKWVERVEREVVSRKHGVLIFGSASIWLEWVVGW
jgi:hypothetical protein